MPSPWVSRLKTRLKGQIEVSAYVWDLLSSKIFGRVHSVFKNGFNLALQDRLVFVTSLQSSTLPALGCRVSQACFDAMVDQIQPGTLIGCQPAFWQVYSLGQGLEVSWQDPRPVDLSLEVIQGSAGLLDQVIADLGGLALEGRSAFFQDPTLQAIYKGLTWPLDLDDLTRLIGLGQGLTPSGDDYLQGALIMDRVFKRPGLLGPLVARGLAGRQTTDIAQAYYRAALAGYANQTWLDWLQAESPGDRARHLNDLLHYGHSSGPDMLLGALDYTNYLKGHDQ